MGTIRQQVQGVALLSFLLLGAGGAPPVSLRDVGIEAGIHELTQAGITPAWIDLDGDQHPEPLWFTYQGVHTLVHTDGEWVLEEIEVPAVVQPPGGAPDPILAVFDADGDGAHDLMVIGHHLHFLRVAGPRKLSLMSGVLPALPGASALGAAAADMNADGLTDVVLSFGVIALELFELGGHRDVILMNRGHMRFETVVIEPSRLAFTNGITVADMDGDFQPDLVESVDFSHFVGGGSRILLNRTPPGAPEPVFEVSEQAYDQGTFGMGAAVDDLNGDGYVDIYNTSFGLDLLVYGRPDGSFEDVTVATGFLHEWGNAGEGGRPGLRLQWCATFADMNLDGRQDVVVRYGGQTDGVGDGQHNGGGEGGMMGDMGDMGDMEGMEGMEDMEGMSAMDSKSSEATDVDLLYLHQPDGTFERVHVPYEPGGADQGRHAVLGDINGDHVPDVALGGKGGSAGFWLNETPAPADGVQLRVDLRPTVTAWPAPGARLVATCGGQIQTRMQTTGGKMGGVQDMAIFIAWPDCDAVPEVEVQWPSGATSTHVADASSHVVAGEPRWWSVPEDTPGVVRLTPLAAGASEACVSGPDQDWVCCVPEGETEACDLPLPLVSGLARLDERPAVALPGDDGVWFLETVPSPPLPGQDLEIHVMYRGALATFQETVVSMFVNGISVPWSYGDDEHQKWVAFVDLPTGAQYLEVSLYPLNMPPDPTWTLPTAAAYDSRWSTVSPYLYQVHGGVTEFWNWGVYVTGIRGKSASALIAGLRMERDDGTVMDGSKVISAGAVRRVRALISYEELAGTNTVTLRDSVGAFSLTLPAPKPLTMEEAVFAIGSVGGGLTRPRVVGGGDIVPMMLSLLDPAGNVMPPEPELVTFEVDGGELMQELDLLPWGGYNMQTMVASAEGEGPGEVRAIGLDGRILGRFSFVRRSKGLTPVGLETSTVQLFDEPMFAPEEATHQLMVVLQTPFGETIVADVDVDIDIEGGEIIEGQASAQMDPGRMGDMGDMGGMGDMAGGTMDADGAMGSGTMTNIRAFPGKHTLVVTVTVNGTLFPVMTSEVDIPVPEDEPVLIPPEPPAETGAEPVGAEPVEEPEPANVSSESGGGCAGSGSGSAGGAFWVLLAGLALVARTGRRPLRSPAP